MCADKYIPDVDIEAGDTGQQWLKILSVKNSYKYREKHTAEQVKLSKEAS